jgi:hypothetical protein
MKNLLTYLIVVLFTLFSYSCNRQRTTRMTIEDNNRLSQIEYAGNIVFNETNTGIIHLSPDGYFECHNNDDKVLVKSDKRGSITYQLNSEDPQTVLKLTGRNLLHDAVKEIAKQKVRRRS